MYVTHNTKSLNIAKKGERVCVWEQSKKDKIY